MALLVLAASCEKEKKEESGGEPRQVSRADKAWDLVITNGEVIDGAGSPRRQLQLGIKDGRIAAMGLDIGPGKKTIDAAGKVVAPGFIDVHTHAENLAEIPSAENFLRMGVTTIVTGNCGGSVLDVAAYFGKCEATGIGVNIGTLIGHNSVRRSVMGGSFIRQPSKDQLHKMRQLVDQAMRDGALGMSTGLVYLPGAYTKTDEIIDLAQVVSNRGGIYASHMRYETHEIFDALEELIEVARAVGIRAHVSHIKLSGPAA